MTLQVTPEQYIFPPRSQNAIPREDTEIFGEMGWIGQLKYNDTHCLIKFCPDGRIQLWNRHAEQIKGYWPTEYLLEELRQVGEMVGHKPGTITILDGGLLDKKHAAIKHTIVVWDTLVLNNEHLIDTTYDYRHAELIKAATDEPWVYTTPQSQYTFGKKFTDSVFIPKCMEACEWDNAWDLIASINAPWTTGFPNSADYKISPLLEGIIYKDPGGVLEFGFSSSNNAAWMIRSRVQTGRHQY